MVPDGGVDKCGTINSYLELAPPGPWPPSPPPWAAAICPATSGRGLDQARTNSISLLLTVSSIPTQIAVPFIWDIRRLQWLGQAPDRLVDGDSWLTTPPLYWFRHRIFLSHLRVLKESVVGTASLSMVGKVLSC